MTALAIVPAAGSGRRFGHSLKLLTPVDGVPMLERTLRALLDGGVDAVVVVVARSVQFDAVTALADPRVRTVVNADPLRGMLSSIQTGVEFAVRKATKPAVVLIHPGDMPFVRPETVATIVRSCQDTGRIVCPVYCGDRGHPVAMPAAIMDDILAAPLTETLAYVLDRFPGGRTLLEVDDAGVVRDIDVPSDL